MASYRQFGRLTDLQEEMDEDPFLNGQRADRGNEEGMLDSDRTIARIYFREMKKVPLLKREKEIELARRIELGERELRDILLKCSDALKETGRSGRQFETDQSHPQEVDRSTERVISEVVRKLESAGQDAESDQNRLRDLLAELKTTEADLKAAKTEMIQSNLRLVVSIAKNYLNRGLSFLDLVQEGNLGLMKAVEKYDYRRGFKFSTYSSWWIRQAITRALADKARTVRIPNHLLGLRSRTLGSFRQLVKELGRKPVAEEIAARARIPLDVVRKVMDLIHEPVSLETPIAEDGSKLEDLIESEESSRLHDDLLENIDQAKKTRNLLSLLNSREERILRFRFGIGEPSTYTLEEIGKRFGISRERVRQIEQKALEKLRSLPTAMVICEVVSKTAE